MTNLITLTIPNDDHIALRAFGKALEEMARAHGASPTQLQVVNEITMTGEQSEALRERLKQVLGEPEVDTTAKQVELLVKPFDERMELLQKALSEETPESLAAKLQSYDTTTDSTGTPWDERIHSASKALNADGTWRLRRKPKDVDEAEWAATVQRVQDELRFHQEPVTVTPVMTDEEVKAFDDIEPPVTPPGDDFHTDAGVVSEQTVAGIPPIPVPPPREVSTEVMSKALAVPYGEQEWTFPKLMTFLTERQGKIDVPTVNMLLAQDGIASLPELNAHPDKIGPFVARVKAHLGE